MTTDRNDTAVASNDDSADHDAFAVGRMVNVKARTWPGVNKHGGIAKIAKLHIVNDAVSFVDVRYTLGGRETKVPVEYVKLAPEYENLHDNGNKLRDRNNLLGRCKGCGSLRADCNSCDWRMTNEQQSGFGVLIQQQTKRRRRTTSQPSKPSAVATADGSSSSSSIPGSSPSSDDDEDFFRSMQRQEESETHQRNFPPALDASSDSSDNEVLAKIIERNRRKKQGLEPRRDVSPEPKTKIFGHQSTAEQLDGAHSPDLTPCASQDESPDVTPRASPGVVGTQDLSSLESSPSPKAAREYEPHDSPSDASNPMPDTQLHDDLEGFIQPEGNAHELPDDIVDMTIGLSMKELPLFFQGRLEHVRNGITHGRVQLANLQRAMERSRCTADFELECRTLHDTLLKELLQNGRDQGRLANKKMCKFYRKEKANLTIEQRRQLHDDVRDLEFENVSTEADDLVIEVMHLLKRCSASRKDIEDDMSFADTDESSEELSDDMVDGRVEMADETGASGFPTDDDFDPHMHASKVRKKVFRYSDGQPQKKKSRTEHRSKGHTRNNRYKEGTEGDWGDLHGRSTKRVPRNKFIDDGTRYRNQQEYRKRRKEVHHEFPTTLGTEAKDASVPHSTLEDDIAAPLLDDLLGLVTSDVRAERHRGEVSWRTRGPRWNEARARNTMEAFLKGNSLNLDERAGHDSENDLDHDKSERYRNRRLMPHWDSSKNRTRGLGNEQRSRAQLSGELSQEELTKSIYQAARDHIATPSGQAATRHPIRRHQETRWLQSEARPVIPTDKLTELCDLAEASKLDRPRALRSFHLVLEIYQALGTRTVQEVIATEPALLPAYETLLVCAFRLLGKSAQQELTRDDGVVFHLFAAGNPAAFTEAIVLQLLDSCYAMLHPVAWATTTLPLSPSMKNTLQTVYKEIGISAPGTSFVAYLLLSKLTSQQWRKSTDEKRVFVSSIDPQRFKSLLSIGTPEDDPSPSRLSKLNERISRQEIEVIWYILAFFSSSSFHHSESQSHWRLIKLLFMSGAGVFVEKSTETERDYLVPSEDHLLSCETQLSYFLTLLSSNSLNPLPKTDGFLQSLIRSCLTLQSKSNAVSGTVSNLKVREESYSMWVNSDPVGFNVDAISEATTKHFSLFGSQTSLERLCLQIVKEVASRLPQKKVRLLRFSKSIQQLESELMGKARELESFPVGNDERNEFAQIFGTSQSSEQENKSPSLFLFEAAANLRFCVTQAMLNLQHNSGVKVFDSFPLNKALAVELWEAFADADMKRRKVAFGLTGKMPKCTYRGSLSRLRSAAKTMSCLVLFNAKEWQVQPCETIADFVEFTFPCCLACLDCSSVKLANEDEHSAQTVDEEQVLALIHGSATWVAMILFQLRSRLVASGTKKLIEVTQIITAWCFKCSRRCLESIARAFNRGTFGDMAFRACLTLVRLSTSLSLLIVKCDARSGDISNYAQGNTGDETEEDFFGDLDDTALLGLCLDPDSAHESVTNTSSSASDIYADIFMALADLLFTAKPSNRFVVSIMPNIVQASSSAGKLVISRQSGAICACLAALTARQSTDDNSSAFQFLCLINREHRNDESDALYLKSIEQCFFSVHGFVHNMISNSHHININTIEVCRLAGTHRQCEMLIEMRAQDAFFSFITAAFDSGAIERFPSCDLKRFRTLSGRRGYEKEKCRLQQENQSGELRHAIRGKRGEPMDFPGPMYNAANLWAFGVHLGRILSTLESAVWTEIGEVLSNATSSFEGADSLIDVSCLEREVLYRIKMGCCLLFSSSNINNLQDHSTEWEKITLALVSTCAMNLVAISEGFDYHNRANSGDAQLHTHKGAKLAILQTCYSHLTITLLSVMICYRPDMGSTIHSTFANEIKDVFLSPILSQNSFDVRKGLHKLAGTRQNDACSAQTKTSSLGIDVVSACLLRCREFVLSMCLSSNPAGSISLFASLGNDRLGLCVDNVHLLIANAFFPNRRRASVTIGVKSLALSNAVDNLLDKVDLINTPDKNSLRGLLDFTAEKVIAHKLQKDGSGIAEKIKLGILKVLDHMFRLAIDEEVVLFSTLAHCLLARSLWATIKTTINSETMDENVLCMAIKCSGLLLQQGRRDDINLPPRHQKTVLGWSTEMNGIHLDETSDPNDLCAGFFCVFAESLNAICTCVANSSEDTQKIKGLRKALCRVDNSPETDCGMVKLIECNLELNRIDKMLFVEKENSNSSVKNVYAKPNKAISAPLSLLGNWKPHPLVCAAAKDFVSVITAKDIL